jgi:alpha-glucuronidase
MLTSPSPNLPHRQTLTNATRTHVGYDRPAYAAMYNEPVAADYGDLALTPNELVLCFQNVPYDHKV